MKDLEVEKHLLPNGTTIEFYPADHRYVYNGVVLPSITTLLKTVYGDTYSSVNPELLKRSADYGTQVHSELQSLIDMREDGIDITDLINLPTTHQETLNYFKFVEPIYKIKPIMTEKIVVLYNDQKEPVAAGRFDLMAEVDGELTLVDFKTTSAIHQKLVTAQLNLYAVACVQTGYYSEGEIKKLGVIHLCGSTSRYKPIPILNKTFLKQFTD